MCLPAFQSRPLPCTRLHKGTPKVGIRGAFLSRNPHHQNIKLLITGNRPRGRDQGPGARPSPVMAPVVAASSSKFIFREQILPIDREIEIQVIRGKTRLMIENNISYRSQGPVCSSPTGTSTTSDKQVLAPTQRRPQMMGPSVMQASKFHCMVASL
jgi:hypothetical protein